MSLHFQRQQPEPVFADASAVVVESVQAFVIAGSKANEEQTGGGADCHSQVSGHWIVDSPIANPMSRYVEYKRNRKSWGIDALGSVVVKIKLTNGIVGVGVSVGGVPACYIVEHHLSRFVKGQDPVNVELIWDQMYRSTLNYGRKGLPLQAISAVDLALWDCLGKLRNEPVYKLLGGKTKHRLPVYATTAKPGVAKQMGFHGAKIPLPFGPADGDRGMQANIDYIKRARELVGEDYPLMIDCYMALTVPYTVELCRKIQESVPGGVKWVEEFLPPDNYQGYADVKRAVSSTLLTTGEHEYARFGFRELLERKCCDVLQPDITWVGGITEAKRIVALASAYDVPVIPHGSSVYSYHLQLAHVNCPMAEYLVLAPNADRIQPLFGNLFVDEPLPKDGFVELDAQKPGFGVTLNTAVELTRPHPNETPSPAETHDGTSGVLDSDRWFGLAQQFLA